MLPTPRGYNFPSGKFLPHKKRFHAFALKKYLFSLYTIFIESYAFTRWGSWFGDPLRVEQYSRPHEPDAVRTAGGKQKMFTQGERGNLFRIFVPAFAGTANLISALSRPSLFPATVFFYVCVAKKE